MDDTRTNAGPRIYLAIDNCFASKRWNRPEEWIPLAKELGVSYVEASADTECDPLYAGPEYLHDWLGQVAEQCDIHGVRIANLYSGHGTYATAGLAHTDVRVRDRIQHDWLEPMARSAAQLGAGLGFFCHAFSQAVLEDPEAYRRAEDDLHARLGQVAMFAGDVGVKTVGVEQMYSPHQIPWTIEGAKDFMARVTALGGHPLYLTIDVGHQSGQSKFLRPGPEAIEEAIQRGHLNGEAAPLWLGSQSAHDRLERALSSHEGDAHNALADICQEMDRFTHMFAERRDGDPYAWLEDLGCYSPIIHLQQTDGTASAHLPFSQKHNNRGIINGPDVLKAIARSYRREPEAGMPPKCSDIFLTIEVFSGTGAYPRDIVRDIADSVAYWRQVVPEDGMTLEEGIGKISGDERYE